MHTSSHEKVAAFVATYLNEFRDTRLDILDVGSQIVSAQELTYRSLFDSPNWSYTGLDVEAGLNVDVVPADAYRWNEIEADTFDVVVSGQTFEHIPFFWATAFEIARVLRPGGLAVITAPGRGPYHRYPVDCWRFHDDGFVAVADHVEFEVLDAFTDWKRNMWEESIVVMRKPVWSPADRDRFATRLWHQRSLTATPAPDPIETAPILDGPGGSPAASPLQAVIGGRYTPVLETLRLDAINAKRARDEASKPLIVRMVPRRIRSGLSRRFQTGKPTHWDEDAVTSS